jgi:molecular chaperone DnaK
LTNLRAALRGQVQVEVAFDINSEGIVSVSAKDKETGQEASIIITPSGGLTEDEMETIISEQDDLIAETGESEDTDAKKSELSELVDQVEDLFPRVKQVLADSEFGMDAVNRVEKTLTTARKALGAKRVATVNHSIEQLSRTLQLFKSLQQRAGIEVE